MHCGSKGRCALLACTIGCFIALPRCTDSAASRRVVLLAATSARPVPRNSPRLGPECAKRRTGPAPRPILTCRHLLTLRTPHVQEIDEWRNILEDGRTLIGLSEMGLPTVVARHRIACASLCPCVSPMFLSRLRTKGMRCARRRMHTRARSNTNLVRVLCARKHTHPMACACTHIPAHIQCAYCARAHTHPREEARRHRCARRAHPIVHRCTLTNTRREHAGWQESCCK